MPYVNIRITREGATAEQKAALISGVTQLLQETLGKNPATTVVVIDEVEMDKLTAALLDVVEETIQPETSVLWLKKIGRSTSDER